MKMNTVGLLTPMESECLLGPVCGLPDVHEAKVRHLQRPSRRDQAVGALQPPVVTQLAVVEVDHALGTES